MRKVINSILIIILIFGFIMGLFYAVKRVYPVEFESNISKYSEEYNLSAALIFSVINVESGFDKNAVSSAGAKGLMQLKDSTAIELANKLGIENYKKDDIFNEDINILFGSFYLRYLLDYYDNNLDLALCAYNAGMGTVNNWLENDEFFGNGQLKLVPYKETQNYLTKVKNGEKIYRYLYGISWFLKYF